jgi:hypothetical protein
MPGSHGSDDVKPVSNGGDPTGKKLTYDDFLLFPDDGKRHELIDGEHYVTPSPNTKHQRVSGNVYFLIRAWLEARPLGQVYYAPYDVVFSRFDVVEPDLLYLSNERAAEVVTAKHVTSRHFGDSFRRFDCMTPPTRWIARCAIGRATKATA